MEMEVDFPRDAASKSQWLLNNAKKAENIYEARSWLITARNAAPNLFSVQFASYELELKEKNSSADAASTLLSLAKNPEFEKEQQLWTEVETVLNTDKNPTDEFRKQILNEYIGKQHRDLIIQCAEKQGKISKNIQLMLMLLEKWPEQISQIGPQMSENLLNAEKKTQSALLPEEQSPLNECRQILVSEVLPVIINSPNLTNLGSKVYYKWFQKAIEFTTVYASTGDQTNKLKGFTITDPWFQLKKLRVAIGRKCNWAEEKTNGLYESVRWLQTLSTNQNHQRKGQQDEHALRKQIFYTAGHLHFEATIRYMNQSEPNLMLNTSQSNKYLSVFPMLNIFNLQPKAETQAIGSIKSDPKELKLEETIELFNAAYEAYKILTTSDMSKESFHKDWAFLEKRWKVVNWIWHRLFLIDKLIKDKAYDSAVTSLSNIIKQPNFPNRLAVRCRAQLGCCYYAMKKIRPSVRPLIECLVLISNDINYEPCVMDSEMNMPRNSQINWVKAHIPHLLPYTIHVILDGLGEIFSTLDNNKYSKVLGWILVLSQHDWPRYATNMEFAVEHILRECRHGGFEYPNLLNFIAEPSVLEELAWLSNSVNIKMAVGTGGALIEKEEFRIQLIERIQDNLDLNSLILNFLMKAKDEIISSIEMLKR